MALCASALCCATFVLKLVAEHCPLATAPGDVADCGAVVLVPAVR